MVKNKRVRYSFEKNELLKKERGVGFEDVILSIQSGYLLDDLRHPNQEKYPSQDMFVILILIKNLCLCGTVCRE